MKPPMKKMTPPTKTRKAPVKMPAATPMPGIAHAPDAMKYRARDAIDTLKRAEEIKADPHLMSHVKAHAVEQRNHLTRVIRRAK